MKKVLNFFGVLGAIFFTIVLTVILTVLVFTVNIRNIVSEQGITNVLKSMDVVETLKTIDDGVMWEDFQEMGENLELTEEQLAEILNSEKVKEEFGEVFGKMVKSITSDKAYQITRDEFIELVDVTINEYNKVAEVKIDKEARDSLVKDFDDELIKDLNESLAEINLASTMNEDDKAVVELLDFIIYGAFVTSLVVTIIILILLIALCRFSYYKWMSYVGVAALLASAFTLVAGLFLSFVPFDVEGADLLLPFKEVLNNNMYVTTGILFVIYAVLIIVERILKKLHNRSISYEKVVTEEPVVEETPVEEPVMEEPVVEETTEEVSDENNTN